jgi:hypothetical protein
MMPDKRMALIEPVEKQDDGDLVREMLAFAAGRIMAAEIEARTGAAEGARTPMREAQRNGYRDRSTSTSRRHASRLYRAGDPDAGQGPPCPELPRATPAGREGPRGVRPLFLNRWQTRSRSRRPMGHNPEGRMAAF